jgi:Spy/CpxP family protein refolding chaperone
MHPAVMEWWKARRAENPQYVGCGPSRQGPQQQYEQYSASQEGWGDGEGGGGFGVRRPLRFLAYKLELDDKQVTELARILDELKTERAQGEVDRRRTLAAFADAVAGATFDEARATEAGQRRVDTAQRLKDAVQTALRAIHALLDPEQREKLAYLIRTGTLII